MSLYPFNEHREQINQDRCPAPFCGCDLSRRRAWITPVTFAEDTRASFTDMATFDVSKAHGIRDFRGYQLRTCDREPCRLWARLRSEDLRGGPNADPVYVAYLWSRNPGPVPPEDMQRERLRRHLDESIDRVQDSLRRRPIA